MSPLETIARQVRDEARRLRNSLAHEPVAFVLFDEINAKLGRRIDRLPADADVTPHARHEADTILDPAADWQGKHGCFMDFCDELDRVCGRPTA